MNIVIMTCVSLTFTKPMWIRCAHARTEVVAGASKASRHRHACRASTYFEWLLQRSKM